MKYTTQSGFVLVYAVFLSGIILTIGLGSLGLVLRGFQLSTTSRDSQKALFAADSAVECVVYWDFHFDEAGLSQSPFAVSSSSAGILPGEVSCNGQDITVAAPAGREQNLSSQMCESGGTNVPSDAQFPFFEERVPDESTIVVFDLHFDNQAYAAVTVERSEALLEDGVNTRISACGFNHDDPNFSRRVERGVTFQY